MCGWISKIFMEQYYITAIFSTELQIHSIDIELYD